jgi:NCAIR mutase (PurE)-related protein
MEQEEIYQLLQQVERGEKTAREAAEDIRLQPEMLVGNYADIDTHRSVRQGMPEVIYGEGKTAQQILGIATAMKERGISNIMVTRLSQEKADEIARELEIDYNPIPRIGIVNGCETEKKGKIVVVAAGTSDLPVAEEAAVTAELYGNYVERVYDVGVAGIHRLLNRLPVLEDANAIVAVAGMEGALVSVVGGLVSCPVIGVPTSVGYGANFGGLAALLSMLNSCASGVSVVNIDNGFGAGVLASKINKQSV